MPDIDFYVTITPDDISRTLWEDMPPDIQWLLPASSWARKRLTAPVLPPHVWDTAADSGGFVATVRWGDYRYTLEEYVLWLRRWKPDPPIWAAMMDYCCEPPVAGDRSTVLERQRRTTAMAYQTWDRFKRMPWTWVPTIQGWEPEDYEAHARELRPLIDQMHEHYAVDSAGDHAFRVGVGTLCARADTATIRQVVLRVGEILQYPTLHLWGVKLGALRSDLGGRISSVDSAAWNGRWGPLRFAHRGTGMTQREYGYRVVLPRYIDKVHTALRERRAQGRLFD